MYLMLLKTITRYPVLLHNKSPKYTRRSTEIWVCIVSIVSWLKPIYERLKSHLCEREVLHADETTIKAIISAKTFDDARQRG